MKTILKISIFFVLICATLNAQEIVVVKPGTTVKEHFKAEEIYKYPDFTYGQLIFINSKTDSALMNYNILFGEMHFIKPPHDTLAIANKKDLKYIIFKTDTFCYNNGYLQYLSQKNRIRLVQKQYVKVLAIKKSSGYGMSSQTSAITNVSSFGEIYGTVKDLRSEDEIVLAKQIDYYFRMPSNEFTLFNKGNILKAFPNEKSRIKEFLKINKIDFKKREDIFKLFDFIVTLK